MRERESELKIVRESEREKVYMNRANERCVCVCVCLLPV